MAKTYGTAEAAQVLQVSMATIGRMLRDGRLDGAYKDGAKIRIPAQEVEKYLVPASQVEEVLQRMQEDRKQVEREKARARSRNRKK